MCVRDRIQVQMWILAVLHPVQIIIQQNNISFSLWASEPAVVKFSVTYDLSLPIVAQLAGTGPGLHFNLLSIVSHDMQRSCFTLWRHLFRVSTRHHCLK